jgi:hypothetical protein
MPSLICFVLFWVMLVFELRALCLLVRCSTTWDMPPSTSLVRGVCMCEWSRERLNVHETKCASIAFNVLTNSNLILKIWNKYRLKYRSRDQGFFFFCHRGLFFLYFYLNVFTFTYMCINFLCHITPPPTPDSRQNLFCPLLWFYGRENLRENKKDIAFLLVWDKDRYIERFLVLLPCTCVLQPTLIHFYQTFSLLLGHLSRVASANLRLLYLLLNRENINHIQVLGFVPFPIPPVHSLP